MTTQLTTSLFRLGVNNATALLKGLQDAGLTSELLSRFESNDPADKSWTRAMVKYMLENEQIITAKTESTKKQVIKRLGSVCGNEQKNFVLDDFFKEVDQPDGIKLKLSSKFKSNFLNRSGKVGIYVPGKTIFIYELQIASTDQEILTQFGGMQNVKSSPAYMAQQIKLQPQGQKAGALLTNSLANIFYCEDDTQGLWAVFCCYKNQHWFVDADPVSDPIRWIDGLQIYSPAESLG